MDLNLKGKVAIVTGGAAKVGLAISRRLADEGASLVFTYLTSKTAAMEARDELAKRSGCEVLALQVDVTKPDQVDELVQTVTSKMGHIDILVNNAGYNEIPTLFLDSTYEEWQANFGVFTFGAMTCCQKVAPVMIRQKKGKIVNMVGDAGKTGEIGRSVVAAARAATMAFTKSLAKELGRYNVHVNAVSVGLVNDPVRMAKMSDELKQRILNKYSIRRFGEPDDLAPMVALLASDLTDWMTGQIVSVSGGYSMV